MLNIGWPSWLKSRTQNTTYISKPSRGRQITQVEDVGPAEIAEQAGRDLARLLVVPGDEDRRLAGQPAGIDHHRVGHRVERLDQAYVRQLPLQLLDERVGVADEQRRWKALGVVERVGGVDHHLAVQPAADRPQGGQRSRAAGGVDEDVPPRSAYATRFRLTSAHSSRARVRSGSRVPMVIWWPAAVNARPRARPTSPDPRMAISMTDMMTLTRPGERGEGVRDG